MVLLLGVWLGGRPEDLPSFMRSFLQATAKALLAKDGTAQWLDYQRLIGRWRVLSHLALHAGAKDWTVSW